MEKIRSFIAIELPEEVKKALSDLQNKFKKSGSLPVKWVDPGNIHLTLKFLGDVDADSVEGILKAMEEAVKGAASFNIEVKGLGVFPNMNRIQIVWVGLHGELEKLGDLQKKLETNLKPLGFMPENRPFTPHLTLARVRDFARPEERQRLGRLVSEADFEEKHVINVTSLNLMKSVLTREGPIYSRLGAVTLK
ncbi:MAG: RNA 2',3'-cyclic phosphodiesterase [Dehalococcoidales bacterium]|nr:RNA 2',3'-cyclic phosphodiesterase [Dehalococcoidales bacterium]